MNKPASVVSKMETTGAATLTPGQTPNQQSIRQPTTSQSIRKGHYKMNRPTSIYPSRIARGLVDVCDQDGHYLTSARAYDGVVSATANGTRLFVNYSTKTDIYECASGNAQLVSTTYH